MESEKKAACPYLKETGGGNVCRLMGCLVKEIRFTDICICMEVHEACQVYRRYSGDHLEV